MQIGKHSGWRQPENAAEASCRIPCDASSVEVSIAAQREPSATTMEPCPREAEKHAFHSSRRYLVDRAGAVASADRTTPVHIAVAALHDVAFGLAGVGRTDCEGVQHGGRLRLRRNGRPGEHNHSGKHGEPYCSHARAPALTMIRLHCLSPESELRLGLFR